jgi:hypothetical protein
MKTYRNFINEAYMLQFVRDKNMDVLKIKDSRKKSWVEIRGKKGYEISGYDKRDRLHRVLDQVGKSANMSDLMNGKPVSINPKHPDGKKAIRLVKKIMDEK